MIPTLPVVLASGSPRRQALLSDLGVTFKVILHEIDETYPEKLQREEVALFLARKKAAAYDAEVEAGQIVITADTIVCIDDIILGKPSDFDDGVRILKLLSGKKHEVITAVCIRTKSSIIEFFDTTSVYFKILTEEEIRHYMDRCKPYDKAGSYGIQDWIGLIGIDRIDGSYFNVMGLPVNKVYDQLMQLSRTWHP
jgi:septum formation protein